MLADQILEPVYRFRFGNIEFHRPKRRLPSEKIWDRHKQAIPNSFSRDAALSRQAVSNSYGPDNLKLPIRVCQGAVVPGGGNGGVGVGRGSPLT